MAASKYPGYKRAAYWHSVLAAVCGHDPKIPEHILAEVIVAVLQNKEDTGRPVDRALVQGTMRIMPGRSYKCLAMKWRQVLHRLHILEPPRERYREWYNILDAWAPSLNDAYLHCREGRKTIFPTICALSAVLPGFADHMEYTSPASVKTVRLWYAMCRYMNIDPTAPVLTDAIRMRSDELHSSIINKIV